MLSRRLGPLVTKSFCKPIHLPQSPFLWQYRNYARSRFEERGPGSSRTRPNLSPRPARPTGSEEKPELSYEGRTSVQESPLWEASQRPPASDPEEGLMRLLMENEQLIVTRQIEMLNIFVGFEQSNKYVITNEREETLGFIAEEPRGFLTSMGRQILRTHRPFRALVMDSAGSPILWLRRPFAFINSRMYVQRLKDFNTYTPEGEPVLDTFAEAQQIWHLWRRKYDLFLRRKTLQILSTASESQSEPEPEPETFHQFSTIDEGLLAWSFTLRDHSQQDIASVNRAFRGFGREIFTDTGQYFIRFGPQPLDPTDPFSPAPPTSRTLTLDEKAAVLAMAVNIDFDYFSRHSEGGHGFGLGLWGWGGAE